MGLELLAKDGITCQIMFDVILNFSWLNQTYGEALGDGIWRALIENKSLPYPIDVGAYIYQYKDSQFFHRLEEQGFTVEVPWNKISALFNLARLFEQLNNTESASILYRLILFKVHLLTFTHLSFAIHNSNETWELS